jgi:hypothetical protein
MYFLFILFLSLSCRNEIQSDYGATVEEPSDPTSMTYNPNKETALSKQITPALRAPAKVLAPAVDINKNPFIHDPSLGKIEKIKVSTGRTLLVRDFAVALQIKQNEFSEWNSGSGFRGQQAPAKIAKELYEIFSDSFDIIFYVSNNEQKPNNVYYGILSGISNHITGIGKNIGGRNAQFGSKSSPSKEKADFYKSKSISPLPVGKLKAISHFSYLEAIKRGPTLHELAHIWANHIVDTKILDCNDSECKTFKERPNHAHWNYSNIAGHAGGSFVGIKKVAQKKDTYKFIKLDCTPPNVNYKMDHCGGNMWPYPPLELYLMGLIPKDKVADFETYSGLQAVADKSEIIIKKINHYSIDDIIKKLGPRIPSYKDSQKEFRIITVLLTKKDPTEKEWSSLKEQLAWLTHKGTDNIATSFNFWEATGGRASLVSDGLLNLKK